MVTLGRGQPEDKELDDWGVSWWRGQQAPSRDRCVKYQNIKESQGAERGGDKWRTLAKTVGLF